MPNQMLPALLQIARQQQALGALKPAYESATGRFATNYYNPYTSATAGSPQMQANALGLNGAAGNQAATNIFQAGPGYQFALDQGLQALDRTAASRGMLASGNNTQDILRYAQGLANQEYGNWQDRLGQFSNLGMNAAQGQTGRQGALAGIDTGYGNAQAGVYQNTADNLTKLFQPQPQQQSGHGSAIQGGLNLGGSLLGGYLSGGLSGLGAPTTSAPYVTTPYLLSKYNGQAEWSPW